MLTNGSNSKYFFDRLHKFFFQWIMPVVTIVLLTIMPEFNKRDLLLDSLVLDWLIRLGFLTVLLYDYNAFSKGKSEENVEAYKRRWGVSFDANLVGGERNLFFSTLVGSVGKSIVIAFLLQALLRILFPAWGWITYLIAFLYGLIHFVAHMYFYRMYKSESPKL